MPPKRDEAVNDWAELRRTLVAMQENFQTMLQNSIQELTDTVLHQREQDRVAQEADVEEDNPFAANFPRRRRGGGNRVVEQDDRRWETGFKLDIPEFHGGVRGEELFDWLVAVEEVLEFKEVPEDRKVPLVATKFRGKAAAWWM
ncbi:hypothetical protein EUTSA_v10016056mg [Eutrema salsugineum]|uniref:Retrotransposon gag domain-containing protein n=1 Tax=Eutrema salsugineum TaxID=72664 RepID=V4LUR8_EUTSA|nr:hypothetical protein EUTSA_v10016056mg [Eutrema salsugineum]